MTPENMTPEKLPDDGEQKGRFVIKRGIVPDGVYQDALGGLSTNYPEHTLNHTNSLGKAAARGGEIIFVVTADINHKPNGGGQGLVQIVEKIARSGVAELASDASDPPTRYEFVTFDAGSSVALAYRKPDENLRSVVLGDKHVQKFMFYYVPTYLMFKSEKRSEESP